MSKVIIERNPFRQGTASRAVYGALAEAKKPLSADEVAKIAKVSGAKARTLLAAYRNPFHCAPLKKAGARLNLKDGKFSLEVCKPDPKARRPERGKAARMAKKATKKSGKKPVKTPKTETTPAENSTAPANQEPAPEIGAGSDQAQI